MLEKGCIKFNKQANNIYYHCELSTTSTQSISYEAIGFKDPIKQNSTKYSGCAM
jgi:hypothetical protein